MSAIVVDHVTRKFGEFVALRDWASVGHDKSELARLKLGVDLGVPLSKTQGERRERLLSEFKWQRALDAMGYGHLRSATHLLQERFLEYAMLVALAD